MPTTLALTQVLITGPHMGRVTKTRGALTFKLRSSEERKVAIITLIPEQVKASAFYFKTRRRRDLTIDAIRVGRMVTFTFTGTLIDEAISRVSQAADFSQIERVLESFVEIVLTINLDS